MPSLDRPSRGLLGVLIGCGVFAALGKWCAGLTGTDGHSASRLVAEIFMTAGLLAMAWLLAACGYGWLLRRWLVGGSDNGLAMQLALGVAAMLMIDQMLGSIGMLQIGGSIAAWIVLVIGWGLLIVQWNNPQSQSPKSKGVGLHGLGFSPGWLGWTIAPAVTVLLVAACSVPGWLWESEFGGYDALSYHLQLPKEWLTLRRIEPLEHNVYSFLPGYTEAAFYHLAVMMGDGIRAAYACQLLHAAMTLVTAAIVHRLASSMAGPIAGAVAASALLVTPWVIVVGSLAYNEIVVLMMLAAGWLAACDKAISLHRRAIIVGILAGAACGAKLTAAGFVAIPLAIALLAHAERAKSERGDREDSDSKESDLGPPLALGVMALCAGAVLLPYFIRNAAHSGNPVFPFATSWFGTAHWTPEQVEIWNRGHFTQADLWARLRELWQQFFGYGLGTNPAPNQSWKPQWSIIPWLGLGAVVLGLSRIKEHRRQFAITAAIMIVQLIFWIAFTHLKSRFLLPIAVPMAVSIGVAAAGIIRHRASEFAAAVATLALSSVVVWIFATERGGAPAASIGTAVQLTGESLDESMRQDLGRSAFPSVAINYLLLPDSKTLLIGDATPFYYRSNVAYHTTWDRGLLSQLMRDHPDDMATWAAELRNAGFTHLLIDRTMLRIWERSGWNDPLVTVERIDRFASHHSNQLWRYSGDVSIHEVLPE